jgi:pimeloyl-ACP methyl ester carboxylesterase
MAFWELQMRHVLRLGSREVSYIDSGSSGGRALLLLHAFPLTAKMWRPQLAAPPEGWRAIAPDFAGLGHSDDTPTDPPALDDYATDTLAVMDVLGIDKAAVAGVSLGGYVAFALARRAPERLSALVLSNTRASADNDEARRGRARAIETVEEGGTASLAASMLPRLLGSTTRRDHAPLADEVRTIIGDNPVHGIRRAILRLRDRPDATPVLERIDVPTLVIAGDEDEIVPTEEAKQLAAAIPVARFEIIPGAGHLSSLEQPDAWNRAVAGLLAGV